MVSIEQLEDKLIIKENPNKLWILIIFLFVVVWLCNFFGLNEIFIGISMFLFIVFFLGVLLMITNSETIIDKKKRELTINGKGLFSFNNRRQIYKFDDLAETIEFEKKRVGKVKNYFAYVKKTNSKKVELFGSSELGEEKFFTLLKLSNQHFISLDNKDFQLPIN